MTTPTPLAEKMDHLKTLLVNAKEFIEPMDYLFDVLAPDERFLQAGKPLTDKLIKSRFEGIAKVLQEQIATDAKGPVTMLPLLWLKEFQFAHGGWSIGHWMGITFYFRDLDMGLSAISSLLKPDQSVFTRFSVYDPVGPSRNLQIDRSGHRH